MDKSFLGESEGNLQVQGHGGKKGAWHFLIIINLHESMNFQGWKNA